MHKQLSNEFLAFYSGYDYISYCIFLMQCFYLGFLFLKSLIPIYLTYLLVLQAVNKRAKIFIYIKKVHIFNYKYKL